MTIFDQTQLMKLLLAASCWEASQHHRCKGYSGEPATMFTQGVRPACLKPMSKVRSMGPEYGPLGLSRDPYI